MPGAVKDISTIEIIGAKENNLKDIDITIPRSQLTCLVGVSGSGKSTIAFDIVAREGQRQYFESLPSYARRYLDKINQPNVEAIKGISAAIVINQDRVRGNPRSTVGTLTEAYTYLRLLYSRVGLPAMDSSFYSFNHPNGACPKCKGLGRAVQVNLDALLDRDKSLNEGAVRHTDWRVGGMRWNIIRSTHFFDINKPVRLFTPNELERLLYAPRQVVADQSEIKVIKWTFAGLVTHMMERNTKVHRGPTKHDLLYFNFVNCPQCHGDRLNTQALAVKLQGQSIGQVAAMAIPDCLGWVESLVHPHADVIKPRLIEQLQSLIKVGVGYLSLNRSTDTLSGGEAQRVKMSRQMGCDLVETVYVLDEPTAGLHPRDVNQVVSTLKGLRDKGNTVLVVEHDDQVIRHADHIIEVGPGGGKDGGTIVATGSTKDLINSKQSLTGSYLKANNPHMLVPKYRQAKHWLSIVNATRHNLKHIDIDIPLGVITAITGVSGSGKSSLAEELVSQHPSQVTLIDQKPIGTNKRGCIATYIGIFDTIRSIFAKENHVGSGWFSYNTKGACPECRGLGYRQMDMHFLGDIKVTCSTCLGKRYNPTALGYLYQGQKIADVLHMTAAEAGQFFIDTSIRTNLTHLHAVGMDYMELGQTLDTLSGGEAQRLKLISKLHNRGAIYLLDEPTAGLHPADVEKLKQLLNRLVDSGNSVVVIEHNLDMIAHADWVIDLGLEGGERGGEVIAQGSPIQLARHHASYTGNYLRSVCAL